MNDRFSNRHGFHPADAEITIRDDAPQELRSVLVDIAYECALRSVHLRRLVCNVLRVAADPSNWGDFPYVDTEIRQTLAALE